MHLQVIKQYVLAVPLQTRTNLSVYAFVRSELQRLPYLSPRMFVVDPMHNVWEGLFRDLLGKLMNRPEGMELWADDESEGDTSGEGGGEGDGMGEGDDEEGMGGDDYEDDWMGEDVGEGGDGDDVGTKRLKGWEELLKRWRFPRNVGPMMGKIGHKLSKLKV
jgi:hypothetical protein